MSHDLPAVLVVEGWLETSACYVIPVISEICLAGGAPRYSFFSLYFFFLLLDPVRDASTPPFATVHSHSPKPAKPKSAQT